MAIQKLFSYGEFEGDGVFDFSPETDYAFCVFSDLHYGYGNYNCFRCTRGLERLQKIIDDSQNCDFFLSLGDFADNLVDGVKLYEELSQKLAQNHLKTFNGKTPLLENERYLYNVVGNHEIAFAKKDTLAAFTPIEQKAGNCYAFSHKGTLFLAYDAVFSAQTGGDNPKDILDGVATTLFTIPKATLNYLQTLLKQNVTEQTQSIVAFTHISLKNIEEGARNQLLQLLLSYHLPVYLFDGHAHRENYQLFVDGENALHAFTLPAVCDNQTYNRYEVIMRNGKLLRITAFEKEDIQ